MIQSIQRAAAIIRAVSAGPGEVSLVELARRVKLNKTTVFHLAETLVAESFLKKNASGYAIGTFWNEIANEREPWYEASLPSLRQLHRQFPELTLYLSYVSDGEIVMPLEFPAGPASEPKRHASAVLNPYLSLSGILHFALQSDEQMATVRLNHPFEYKGLQAWGSRENFQASVSLAKERSWAEAPILLGARESKWAMPWFSENGGLLGALTFGGHDLSVRAAAQVRKKVQDALKKLKWMK